MKNIKRRLEFLSFYDHTGIEKHLENMARKGWILERISNYFWTYRKIEPQELHFTVSYYPEASDFDPVPSESQQTFIDFCEKTKWKLACTWFQMQIFYNSEDESIPINTDPSIEVETIHDACMTNFLRTYALLFVISLICMLFIFASAIHDILKIIANSSYLVLGTLFFLLFLICSVELLTYYIWHKKAQKAAEQEMFLETPSTSIFQTCILGITISVVMYWIISLAFNQSPWIAWRAFIFFLCTNAVVILSQTVKNFLKRDQVSASTNRILSLIATIVIAFVIFGTVSFISTSVFPYISINNRPISKTSCIQLSDLTDTKSKEYRTMIKAEESILLGRLEFRQKQTINDSVLVNTPELNYELYKIKIPYIYDFCKEQLLQNNAISEHWETNPEYPNSNPWGTLEAYRFASNNETEKSRFLLCYNNKLIQIEFNWEPTIEQMTIIGEKLGSV